MDAPPPHAAATTTPVDLADLAALKAGDEATFTRLVELHNEGLQRLAYAHVRDRAAAQDVVQEAWVAFLESLDRFEARSSLKTWLYRILINCARSRVRRDTRSSAFSRVRQLANSTVAGARFYPGWLPGIGGHWRAPPVAWTFDPEERALAAETRGAIRRSIDALPDAQREVILLRDVIGCSAAEACNVLGLTDTNQRVLLHRARSNVRRALERMGEPA